jgi:galactonate dehydratase
MHGRFTASEAVRVAALLEPFDPEWIEEPIPPENPAMLASVRAATRIPIATGERVHTVPEFRELFERGLVDVVQADLTHVGGFLAMKRLAGWADAYVALMAPHNVAGPVATAANLHFAAATPNYKILEHFNDFADPWLADLVDAAPTVDPADGCLAVPDRPGLGVQLNRDACLAHPRTGARIELFRDGWESRGTPTGSDR